MSKSRILVVDDEVGILEVCADTLARISEAEVLTESDPAKAAARVEKEGFDLVIADIRMPGMTGIELLEAIHGRDPAVPVLMMTAFPTVETAVEAMRHGAADYVVKPFLPEDLVATARRLLESRRLREENRLLERHVERSYVAGEIVGRSAAMRLVHDTVGRLCRSDVDVLITGETGTGKELVARAIHNGSPRKDKRFVPVDCAAIPEALLESEFFGHERGAFTGANARTLGLLEFADGGTLFLDELGELPLAMQAKLLRSLQERRIRRVGGTQEIPVNVRIVAATGRDLTEEVREKRFRSDLYYRINVVRINLPPLRERVEDIPLLVGHFVQKFGPESGGEPAQVDPEMLDLLMRYPWPGNVRELQNVIRRALAMRRREALTAEDLPDEIVVRAAEAPAVAGETRGGFAALREHRVAAFEKEYIANLLLAHHGDVMAAVREAGIPRTTFYRLMKRHSITPDDFRRATAGVPSAGHPGSARATGGTDASKPSAPRK